jgi:ubiquinone/menaquinone biosynthesis C-methylase UbiE
MVDSFFSRRKTKTLAWKLWYPYVTRRLKKADVLFLNYAFVEESPDTSPLVLEQDDEKNRACISLYHHLAQQVDLNGKSVLEVSCGHGGGASFISRYHLPGHLTAVDLNREGIGFCKERHPLPNLDFLVANAENLPLPGNTFDVVVNVEASHAYGDFSAFVSEVCRVLKPGGHFLYADFRSKNQLDPWESDLVLEEFQLVHSRDITEQVVRGMEQNSEQSNKLVVDQLPFYLRFIGRVFAGIKGTRIFNAMKKKDLVYRSYHFVRSAN